MEADQFDIILKTDIDMGSRAFAEQLLQRWARLPERLRVDRYGAGEPVRTPFDLADPAPVVDLWVNSGRPLYFRRSKDPKFQVTFEWRSQRGKDTRSHPWSCTAFLPLSTPLDEVRTLFRFLIESVRPAWGTLSTWAEITRGHKIVFRDRLGESSKYVGLDVGATLPGLHRETYFDAERVNRIGLARFARLPAGEVADFAAGKLVSPGEPYDDRRRAVTEILGREHFFDRDRFDPRTLGFNEETARAIEAALARHHGSAGSTGARTSQPG